MSTASPVVVVATLHAAPGRQQDAIDALLAGIAPVHDEPGCSLYALHAGPDDTVVIVEKWESAEALDAHAAGHAVAANDARLEGLLGGGHLGRASRPGLTRFPRCPLTLPRR